MTIVSRLIQVQDLVHSKSLLQCPLERSAGILKDMIMNEESGQLPARSLPAIAVLAQTAPGATQCHFERRPGRLLLRNHDRKGARGGVKKSKTVPARRGKVGNKLRQMRVKHERAEKSAINDQRFLPETRASVNCVLGDCAFERTLQKVERSCE
jgi:hypothetical protein